MKILIPTDFSEFSLKAIEFGIEIAKKTNGSIYIFTSIHVPGSSIAMMNEMMDVLEKETQNDLNNLLDEVKSEVSGEVDINGNFSVGDPVMAINEFSGKIGADLIVMGTKGASGLKKALIGSNASGVIKNTKIPVLLIPEDSNYLSFNEILYASDLKNMDSEIDEILSLFKLWTPSITVLHIFNEQLPDSMIEDGSTGVDLIRRHHYDKLKFKSVKGKDPLNDIENYIIDNPTDLIILFSEKRSLLQSIFDSSLSKKMAFHAKTPMLVIPKK
ncbi:MAG: hypothetical protein EA412_03515 [Chitinophagaceae bacterium]|nr:MAG: hypothetical protein EA412_03515 [Chitinophagaceae bacterium]